MVRDLDWDGNKWKRAEMPFAFNIKKRGQFCRVCIRQYSKNTQQPALQEGNESTNRRVRTLFLYMPLKLQSAHWFFPKIFCRIKAPKNAGGFCDEKHL